MRVQVGKFPVERATPYPRARAEIKSGDILLCSGSGWFSKMIQRATKSVWSHVGFVMRLDSIDRVMVLESVEPLGVRTVPLSKYLKDYNSRGDPYPGGLVVLRHDDFGTVENKDKFKKFSQHAVDLFGYPYDKDEIAKITARIVASFLPFTKKEQRALKRDREFICSEYAWECFKSVGITIPNDTRGFISPADFAAAKKIRLQAVLKKG